MANTTNFNWETPDDTDLVKDGAAAIRTLGNSIDTSFVDLKGGTTGQVLAKASNTDLDFTWASDATGIPATIFDAKGDIIAASAADTAARLAVGANDTVLTADSSTATGLKWATPASGGWTLINAGGTSLTGTTVTISSIPATYRDLVLVIQDAYPVTDAANLRMRFNGVSTSSYNNSAMDNGGGGTFAATSINLTTEGMDNSVRENLSYIQIFDYTNAVTWKMCQVNSIYCDETTTANYQYTAGMGYFNGTSAISSISLFMSSGDFNGGTAYLYGVK